MTEQTIRAVEAALKKYKTVISMKKRRLLSLFLVFALLAGCAPAAETPAPGPVPTESVATPAPTPEPAPAPEPVDFREFLDGVNAARKAVVTQEEPIDISAYTPDFHEQNHTFTEQEMGRLTTAHGAGRMWPLTLEDALDDVDTFFLLLQTTYGAYYYFGGDDVFLPIRDAVKEELAALKQITAGHLENLLYKHLSPVLVDGHFMIGLRAPRDTFSKYMYYVPDLYLDGVEGAENPGYLKPTIGPDGRICYWYAALSHNGSDLPGTLDGHSLQWQKALMTSHSGDAPAFSEAEWEGVPILTSRRMHDGGILGGTARSADQEALARFSSCGGEYADSPLLIFDLRGNGGGNDRHIMGWFQGWTGTSNPTRGTGAHRYSQLSCRIMGNDYPAERMGTWGGSRLEGTWAERSGPVFVLQDKGAASSGETAVEFFRTAADTLFVGGPTAGMALVPNNMYLYLPHSGLQCYFGTGLYFCETDENRDGVGYLPDLWVEPTQAMELTQKLIEFYGLNRPQ